MSSSFRETFNNFLKDNFDYNNLTNNDLFYYFIKNSFDILIIRDFDLKTVWLNRLPCKLTDHNLSYKDIMNNPCYRVLFQNNKPCENCPVIKSRESKRAVESEVKTPNGEVYMVRSYPLKNESEMIVGFVEVILNITKKIKLKDELESEKLKTDFFTNLSHEFKTPINMMYSTLQVLEKKMAKINDQQLRNSFTGHIKILKQNNLRLFKMISNIMDIHKIDKGYYKNNPQNFNIIKVIRNTVSSCKDYAKKQNKILKFSTDVKTKMLACDPFDIERIILNLISNSLKFTEPGDTISVSIIDNDNELQISVYDTGIGIPEEFQNKIFEKFNQVENSLIRKNEGTGLGMYIVKFLVELHGGEIKLKSKAGKWTEFIIKLPVNILTVEKDDTNSKIDIEYNMIDRINIELSDL